MPQSSRPRAGASGAPAAQNGSAAGADADAERADLLGNTASIFSLGENLSALAVGFGAGAGDLPDLLASDSGTSISSAPSGASNRALTSSAHSAHASQVRCSCSHARTTTGLLLVRVHRSSTVQ